MKGLQANGYRLTVMGERLRAYLWLVLVVLSLSAQAAKDPQYQFYSTSMLSPNKQSNYAPSHINQSGAVKVQLSANKRVPLYQMGTANGANTRVFSAEAFLPGPRRPRR